MIVIVTIGTILLCALRVALALPLGRRLLQGDEVGSNILRNLNLIILAALGLLGMLWYG